MENLLFINSLALFYDPAKLLVLQGSIRIRLYQFHRLKEQWNIYLPLSNWGVCSIL